MAPDADYGIAAILSKLNAIRAAQPSGAPVIHLVVSVAPVLETARKVGRNR